MYPILGRYGPFFFFSYTAVLGGALLLTLAWLRRSARQAGHVAWQNAVIIALGAGLLCGRAGFVAAHAAYFQQQPAEGWMIWRGGLNYHAFLAGSLAALFLWTRLHRRPFFALAIWMAPAAAAWGAAAWLACWLEGCAYGREASPGWFVADLPDSYGVYALRYQTQLLGVALFIVLTVVLLWLRPRLAAAPLFWLGLALGSAAHAAPGLWRGDAVPMWGGWRYDVVLDGLLVGGAGMLFLASATRARMQQSRSYAHTLGKE